MYSATNQVESRLLRDRDSVVKWQRFYWQSDETIIFDRPCIIDFRVSVHARSLEFTENAASETDLGTFS